MDVRETKRSRFCPHLWSGAVGHCLNDPLTWDFGTETFLSIPKYDVEICCVCWLTHKNIWSTKDSEIWLLVLNKITTFKIWPLLIRTALRTRLKVSHFIYKNRRTKQWRCDEARFTSVGAAKGSNDEKAPDTTAFGFWAATPGLALLPAAGGGSLLAAAH